MLDTLIGETVGQDKARLQALLPYLRDESLFRLSIDARSSTEKTTGPALVVYLDGAGVIVEEFFSAWFGF